MIAPFWPYTPTQLPLVVVSAFTKVAPGGGGPVLERVTETAAEVVAWPKLSVAIAERECVPLLTAVVSHDACVNEMCLGLFGRHFH